MTTLTALPRDPQPWNALLAREDVVLAHGMLHLVHEDVSPSAAHDADLLFIAQTLEDAGITGLLVRRAGRTTALAIDLDLRTATLAALTGASAREPLYAKVRGGSAIPLHDVSVPSSPSALRVFRPRITADGAMRYGAATAVNLEFWRFGADVVHAPHANALTRKIMATDDLTFVDIEAYGRSWRTISGMFDPQPSDVTHPVDMVFSWVDGSSSEFQRQRAAAQSEYVVGEGDDGPARYRHVDELRFALRSVNMYAPWVRRIFIATDSERPAWLAEHPKVTIVRSEDFFPDPSVLPIHNSHAVESQLHRIDGLAEHFLYSNDDMFFGRPVEPELFFSAGGVTRFVESGVRIGTGAPRAGRSGHDNALRVNRALLERRFGRVITHDLEHCPVPLRRSILSELEEAFPDDFARTSASRFRSATDISVTNSLYHYYSLFTGRAVSTREPRVRYLQTTLSDSLGRMERLAERRDIDMFCLNDGGEAEVPEHVRVRTVQSLLGTLFPVRAPWERSEVAVDTGTVSPGREWAPSVGRSGSIG
ncbi:stealth conserved region 3 domain-containing protein [Microbacterium rhizomatis]|uniref:Sugar phosphotransferase n=1 Tax=Microbacterium rhizomatis TaxID=1631477 RepID=A0A5J5IZG6_9MICO|nr:stealth conserved region 3 domain-containing protein [Microbacterium rhizomatis]KAA9105630.1 sugar phosphotransferase [Microbacterium rhizomatis]